VDVQNRLSRASAPPALGRDQQGVRVEKSRSNFLLFTILSSDDPAWDPVALGDYAVRNVVPELQRVPGVGQAQLFGTERAMRIWIDPAKLLGLNLSRPRCLPPSARRTCRCRPVKSAACPTWQARALRPPWSSRAS
jgi:multidrug efflux pump